MKSLERGVAILLATLLIGAPFQALGEENVLLADPVIEATQQETLTIEEGTGEMLGTSTAAILEPIIALEEILPEPSSVLEGVDPESYVAGEVIVKFEDETEPVLVETDNVPELISELLEESDVEYAEPNYLRTIDALSSTTDPFAEELWGLSKIQASEAWEFSTGEEIIVAVIDTAIDTNHPDLAGRLWDGTNCVGVDYEGNSINGGCVHGFDFVDNDFSPHGSDESGTAHGTHVAGTIAANFNNQVGITGVAPSVKIMALRIIDNDGKGTVSRENAAIRFAIANGARVINASFSGYGNSFDEYAAIEQFQNIGGLFIAAAGNGGRDFVGDDLDSLPSGPYTPTSVATPAYPAQHPLPGIISVAATTPADTLSSFSNYGAVSVDLGAPGSGILSTVPNEGYDTLSGTSMAVPHVAGTVALLKAFRPGLSVAEVKSVILSEGDTVAALSGTTVSGKRLNAYNALLRAEVLTADTNPPVITLLGDNPLIVTVGGSFNDPGATAHDETDGDLTAHILVSGAVDTSAPDTFILTYSVTDSSSNIGTATREVVVEAAPVQNDPPRRRGGGGGGGGKSDNPERLPQVLGSTSTLTPEVQAEIARLMALVQQLLALIQAMKAAGLP